MKKVYIVAAKRSAIGKMLGSLSGLSAAELASQVMKDILNHTKIDPSEIDEVIGGCVLTAGNRQGVIRQAALLAGIPSEVPAYTLNMICGSGLKAVMNGYQSIMTGTAEIVLAGGTETMSNAGFVLGGQVRNGVKMGNLNAIDHMVCDGLTDGLGNYHMGITAENIAEKYNISREEQDEFAAYSQQKAIHATDSGYFKNEITPIEVKMKREVVTFDTDEFPNRSTNIEKLAKLRPAFTKEGTVTAGNASGINDGASFTLLVSEEKLKALGLTPLAEIVAIGQGGVDPTIMGLGPVPAVRMALKNGGLKLDEIELLELNEAFAAQAIGVAMELSNEHGVSREWLKERTNINGGAIAIGHPIGASGNRILVTLIHSLIRENKNIGLASLCIGGGMGTAVIVKKCN